MTRKIHEKNGVFVPPSSHFSYVLSITLHQPTIRIKIPKVLVKVMKRRNQSENDENGGKNKNKKYLVTSKKSFGKKVGSMFSNVFGKKSPGTDSNEADEEMKKLKIMVESVDLGSEKITGKSNEDFNLNEQITVAKGFRKPEKEMLEVEDDEEMKKLKIIMAESVDLGSEKITGKSNEECNLNEQMAVATGFRKPEKEMLEVEDDEEIIKKLKIMAESVDLGSEKITGKSNEECNLNEQMAVATGFRKPEKEMLEVEDEEKEKPIVKEMKERPKSRRTSSKNLSKKIDLELNKGIKIHNVDSNTDLSGACGIVSLKQAENSNDLATFRSKTLTSNRKLKTAWSIKKMTGVLMGKKSQKHELCKKRILMGGKCRPLNPSGVLQYDENGVLMPEIIP